MNHHIAHDIAREINRLAERAVCQQRSYGIFMETVPKPMQLLVIQAAGNAWVGACRVWPNDLELRSQ